MMLMIKAGISNYIHDANDYGRNFHYLFNDDNMITIMNKNQGRNFNLSS